MSRYNFVALFAQVSLSEVEACREPFEVTQDGLAERSISYVGSPSGEHVRLKPHLQ